VVRFTVRLTPRGGSDRIDGVADGVLLVRVRAAPVDGAANAGLLELLAASLRVPRSSLAIERGMTSRRKLIRLDGERAEADVFAAWPGLAVDGR
jgi:uncharacterized protein YggU (UPF0235/DUF167 family)